MAGKGPSPLLGYNTNLRRRGVLCHVQTEDSGIAHPHVITHVFTAGTIIGTRKRSYKEHLGVDDLETVVRKLMQEQHKAMCIALRDGELDANLPSRDTAKMEAFSDDAAPVVSAPPPEVAPEAEIAPEVEAVPGAEVAPEASGGAEVEPMLELELELDDDVREEMRAGTPTPPSPRPAVHAAADAAPTPMVPARAPAPEVATPRGTPLVAPPPTRPPPERPAWMAEPRETPPPPSKAQSKPQHLPADTTYKAKPQDAVPLASPRGPGRTPLPTPRKRASTVPPAPRPVAVGRRAPTEPPGGDDQAGRYSSKAPTLFSAKRGPTPPPPPPPAKEPRRPPSAPRSSIFGQEYISEKSLDEVILAYLSEEMDEK